MIVFSIFMGLTYFDVCLITIDSPYLDSKFYNFMANASEGSSHSTHASVNAKTLQMQMLRLILIKLKSMFQFQLQVLPLW
jgi:hypothetical protein